MKSVEKFKLLFEKHSNLALEKRKKIHSTTEKYVGLILVFNGWWITYDLTLENVQKLVLIIVILIITATSMYIIYRDNLIHRSHSKIIRKLSESLGTFDKDGIIKGTTLYPEKWKKSGNEKSWKGILHHYLIILSMAILTFLVILIMN